MKNQTKMKRRPIHMTDQMYLIDIKEAIIRQGLVNGKIMSTAEFVRRAITEKIEREANEKM